MGFEPVAVEELLRQFKVDEDDLARIRAFGVLQEVSVEALIHDFYDWLEHEPWFSSFFSGGVPPRVKSLQSGYWVDFLKGIVDSDYVERRIVVGKVHAVINLPVSAYLAGMNFCQDWLANRAREVVSDADQCFQLLQSLSRLAQLDTNIVMHVYASQSMETIRAQGELTRKIVAEVSRVVSAAANGDFTLAYNRQSGDDTLEEPLNLMVSNLKRFNQQSEQEKWIKTGIADLAGVIRGGLTLSEVATNSLTFLARYLRALVGVIYVAQDPKVVVRASSYACVFDADDNPDINAGDGLVGQVLIDHEPKHISDLPGDYLQVSTGLGSRSPRHIYLQPLIYERQVKGIMELGFFDALDATQLALLEQISEPVAVSINSALDRDKMEHLLKVSQQTSLELEAQQDELKGANEALEAQAQALKQSEEALTAQKDLLEHSNLELQQKTQDLETQKMEIEAAREELQLKAEQLYLTSQYKSEFLANMSHELRTPLNSLLLLSQSLAFNKLKNLNDEQVEDLNVIHNSGQSLLSLINDILDLSKVEAGKLTIVVEDTALSELTERLRKQFKAEAEKRDLAFQVHLHDDVVGLSIQTDKHRLEQILRNLLSNAFKFTRAGEVSLAVSRTADGVVFHVTDTGIGVSAEQQKVIFDAFQQADGSTSRAYGGTGLGLTISRELASRLGGEIALDSELCRGSTFSLSIPLRAPASAPETPLLRDSKGAGRSQSMVPSADTPLNERTAGAMPAEKPLLIVEDDADFAQTLSRLAIQGGFTPHVAASGMDALMKVMVLSPVGIVLDVGLPDTDGLQVLEALKSSPVTRQIPVHIVSGREDVDIETLRRGAIGFLRKPAALDELKVLFARFETLLQRGIKHVLVIDDGTSFREINQSLNLSDLQIHVATTPEAAFDLLQAEAMDCCILDLDLGNFDGLGFLKTVDADTDLNLPPVIVYTEDTLSEGSLMS